MFLLQPQNLGEQALNKLAEIALASQFQRSRELQVAIKTDPNRLAQGKLASLAIDGEGLILKSGLHVDELHLHMGEIAVSPFKALAGVIELTAPIRGQGLLSLTAANLTRAVVSPDFTRQLPALGIELDRLHCQLLSPQTIAIALNYWTPLGGQQETTLRATVTTNTATLGAAIALQLVSDDRVSLGEAFTTLLLQQVTDVLNLRHFELRGMKLTPKQVTVCDRALDIHIQACMSQFPT